MKHDAEWLKKNNPFHAESGVNCADDFDELARDYHEHQAEPLLDRILELESALRESHENSERLERANRRLSEIVSHEEYSVCLTSAMFGRVDSHPLLIEEQAG